MSIRSTCGRSLHRRLPAVVLAASLLGAVGCDGDSLTDATTLNQSADPGFTATSSNPADARGAKLAEIVLTPSSAELAPGATQQFTATGRMTDGSTTTVRVSFSTNVGTISSSGLYTASQTGGSGRVTASSRGVRAVATVVVLGDSTSDADPAPVPGDTASNDPPAPSVPVPAACADYPHSRLVAVSNAAGLSSAITNAHPGDLISLADGVYAGRFTLAVSGTSNSRITLCGTRNAVLNGGSISAGNGVYLKANFWTLAGFTVTNSLVGIAGVNASDNVIREVAVSDVGQAGMHFRHFSSRNRFERNEIRNTGRYKPEYGEGIYIGSYFTQWVDGKPDQSNGNQILDNRFGPYVTADHIDLKAGTSGGTVRGNVFDGRGMVDANGNNPSWVAVFGDGYTIESNTGMVAYKHGFKVHSGDSQWGNNNVFRNNEADVQAAGYGFSIASVTSGNTVACANVVRNAGWGFSNVKCS